MKEDEFRNSDLDFNKSMYGLTLSFKLHLAVLLNEFDFAARLLASSEMKTYSGLLVIPWVTKQLEFMKAIIEATASSSQHGGISQRWRAKKRMKTLKEAVLYCPDNYMHKLDLIQAEQFASDGQLDLALEKYEAAIYHAGNQGIPPDQGYACERAGRMLLSLDDVS